MCLSLGVCAATVTLSLAHCGKLASQVDYGKTVNGSVAVFVAGGNRQWSKTRGGKGLVIDK